MFPNQPKGKLTFVNVMGIGFDFIGFNDNSFRAPYPLSKYIYPNEW
jgi:hypothetical protein